MAFVLRLIPKLLAFRRFAHFSLVLHRNVMFGFALTSNEQARGPLRNSIIINDGSSYLPRINTSFGIPLYRCPITEKDMVNHLVARGIRSPNYAYQFNIVTGERRLSNSNEGFIQPPYFLEVSFHLSLFPFFGDVLKEFECTKAIAWFVLVDFDDIFPVESRVDSKVKKTPYPHERLCYCLEGRSPNDWRAYGHYLNFTSMIGFRGESLGRDLTKNVAELAVTLASPTHFLAPALLFHLRVMDTETLFESAQQTMMRFLRAGNSSCKRSRAERGSSSATESNDIRLPHYQPNDRVHVKQMI
ncbi:hypothetical protein J1N35_041064 [Gossypium stocksii]|uniref:Uncharacterized protein n=1 Tax=Gossypium stocksii TaxID=47602 RepID=A0A9D3UER9_9ROSI|nr:hypothetical protein J1N35_041064 [Gossypium stocksii]